MGASASVLDSIEEMNFEQFHEITKIYRDEYLPQLSNGTMTEKDVFRSIKERINKAHIASSIAAGVKFEVGDVVRARIGPVTQLDGVVVEILNEFKIRVDFGDALESKILDIDQCKLLVRSDEFEVGDRVEIRTDNSAMYFVGEVIAVHGNKSVDVLMDGDDPDDIERNVSGDNVRKIMTRRATAKDRWRRLSLVVQAASYFGGFNATAAAAAVASMEVTFGENLGFEDEDRESDGPE